jgi:PAS domain S-box-containing protein
MNISEFVPHGVCFLWNGQLIALSVVSDALIGLSYFSIPVALLIAAQHRKDIPIRPLLVLFGLFILFCGTGHVLDIITIWHPIYWIKGWWNLGTAITSVATALVLVPKVRDYVRMPEDHAALRVEAAELLRYSSLLKSVLESVSEGIINISATNRVALANPAARRIVGPRWSALLDGGKITDEFIAEWMGATSGPRRTPEGLLVETYTTDVPGHGRLLVLKDVTISHRVDEERLRLQRIIANMRQGFCIVALDTGTIVDTNRAFEEMLGYGAGELVGQPVEVINAGTPEERHRIFESIRLAGERDGFWEGEVKNRRKNGGDFISYARVTHQREGAGYLSSVQVDITHEKAMRAEKEALQVSLLQAQKLQSLGILAGGVAHDFNNLLTGILGNASLAIDSLPAADPVRPMLADVIGATERAAELTRQLLAYSGRGRFVLKPVDLSGLVEGIAGLAGLSVPRLVTLRYELAPHLPKVTADRSQLQQLIMSLIVNGAEAIGEGGGQITISTGTRTVGPDELRAPWAGSDPLSAGEYVWIEVTDTGSGMDEVTQTKIFDPFFTTKFTGRGLGLAAALGVAKGHGGTISVSSAPGQGSSFRVLLPIKAG